MELKLMIDNSLETNQEIIRTIRDGAWQLKKMKGWGSYYVPCDDTQATTTFNKSSLEQEFIFSEDFVKLPVNIYEAIITFFVYISQQMNFSEVGVLLLRDLKTKQKYRVLVPKQVVTRASVITDNSNYIDLLTGKEGTIFPPTGWAVCGSAHSHNTMSAFYSSTDENDELGIPGLHFVVGKLTENSHESLFSIVTSNCRRIILDKDLLVGGYDSSIQPISMHLIEKAMSYVSHRVFSSIQSNQTQINQMVTQPQIPNLFSSERDKNEEKDIKDFEKLMNKMQDLISDYLEDRDYDYSLKKLFQYEIENMLSDVFSDFEGEDEENEYEYWDEHDDLDEAANLVVDPFYYKS
jgi:hypothetical protein